MQHALDKGTRDSFKFVIGEECSVLFAELQNIGKRPVGNLIPQVDLASLFGNFERDGVDYRTKIGGSIFIIYSPSKMVLKLCGKVAFEAMAAGPRRWRLVETRLPRVPVGAKVIVLPSRGTAENVPVGAG